MVTQFATYYQMNGETANFIDTAWYMRTQKMYSKLEQTNLYT